MTDQAQALTIDKLIEVLELPQFLDMPIMTERGEIPSGFGSHRTDYNEFATGRFYSERTELSEKPTVGEFVAMLKRCNGCYFEGYKGGAFYMHGNTRIFYADHGACGDPICGAQKTNRGVELVLGKNVY